MKKSLQFYFLIFSLVSLGLISCSENESIQPSTNNEVIDASLGLESRGTTAGNPGFNNPNNNDCDMDYEDLRILFIGNSYTHGFTESIPLLVHELMTYNEQNQFIRRITQSGATLSSLISSNSVKDAAQDGNWDFIVLQENSGVVSDPFTHQQFLTAVNNYRFLFMPNSPDAKFLLYSVQPPVAVTDAQYPSLLNNIINVHEQSDAAHTNVYHSHTTEAFRDAYLGFHGYNFQAGMPDRLRPANFFHYRSDGGFLTAVSIYTSIINNKPGIPTNMSFSSGSTLVSAAVPQYDALAQIGYVTRRESVHRLLPNCNFMYAYGVYPR